MGSTISATCYHSQSSNRSRSSRRSRSSQSLNSQQQSANHHPTHRDTDSSLDFSAFADDDDIAPAARAGAPSQAQPEPEVSGRGPLSIDARVEYKALPRGRAQDIFGIVTLQADASTPVQATAELRQPLDLICVLDVSGSMRGEKLRLVQDAVRFVVRESQPQDRLSIVTFNHSSDRALKLRRMDNDGKDAANVATLQLCAGGGTCIASGLETALEVAERRRHRNPVSAILLLTDGRDGSTGHSLARLVSRSQRAGCSLYAFGFGADHDSRLLSEVAEQAKTPFTFVEDVDKISAAFAGAIGGLSSITAQRVEVVLDCSVTLKKVHTHFDHSAEGGRAVVQIPDMLAGERRDVLLELSILERGTVWEEEETLLLKASAKYWDLAAGAAAQTPAAALRLRSLPAGEPQPELEPDPEVAAQRQRVEVAETLRAAAARGDEGRFEDARALLAAHEERLRSAGSLTPVAENLALELEDARNRMSSRSSWELGGGAELRDAMQMHRMQRATNVSASKKCTTKKCSKAMYATKLQSSWISKAGF